MSRPRLWQILPKMTYTPYAKVEFLSHQDVERDFLIFGFRVSGPNSKGGYFVHYSPIFYVSPEEAPETYPESPFVGFSLWKFDENKDYFSKTSSYTPMFSKNGRDKEQLLEETKQRFLFFCIDDLSRKREVMDFLINSPRFRVLNNSGVRLRNPSKLIDMLKDERTLVIVGCNSSIYIPTFSSEQLKFLSRIVDSLSRS